MKMMPTSESIVCSVGWLLKDGKVSGNIMAGSIVVSGEKEDYYTQLLDYNICT